MNSFTFMQKPPARWSALMCFLESSAPAPPRNSQEEQDVHSMLRAIVADSSMETLTTPNQNGNTWVHMCRTKEMVENAFQAMYDYKGGADQVVNKTNHHGQAPFDQHWNNSGIRGVLARWGGHSVKPMDRNTGKGRGKGVRDGLGPDHSWSRQYWRQ